MVESPDQPRPIMPCSRPRPSRLPRWSLPVLLADAGPVTSAGPLVVKWLSGRVDTFEELPVDCELMLVKGHQPMQVPR